MTTDLETTQHFSDWRTQLRQRSIRWIVLDAVGTVITPTAGVSAMYHAAAVRHGSRLSQAEISERFGQVFRKTEWNDLSEPNDAALATSEQREYERWRQIVREVIFDVTNSDAMFHELFAEFANPAAWRCYDDVGPALQQLRTAGFRLAIASNFDARLHGVIAGMPELAVIERCVISSEVGYRKPSRRFFAALLDSLQCSPDAVLMVGDDYLNDVVGAEQAGLLGVLIARKPGATIPENVSPVTSLNGVLAELSVPVVA